MTVQRAALGQIDKVNFQCDSLNVAFLARGTRSITLRAFCLPRVSPLNPRSSLLTVESPLAGLHSNPYTKIPQPCRHGGRAWASPTERPFATDSLASLILGSWTVGCGE